jgi:SOUL heme-binding protein
MKSIASIFIAAILPTWLVLAGTTAKAGYETAPYRIARQDGKFELRDYPALVVAETPMRGMDSGFMRLFHYIGGENTAKQKIAMTTPVLINHAGTTNATMGFVMPASLGTNGAPTSTQPDVFVKQIPAGQFAVYCFSGGHSVKNSTNALAQLTTWLGQQKISFQGEPVFAYFDSPWTLSFFRRNEVMLRVDPQ